MDPKSAGEEFLELGLLFIVTGLAVVLMVAMIEFILLRETWVASNWGIAVLGVSLILVLAVLVYKLFRRLFWFLRGLR